MKKLRIQSEFDDFAQPSGDDQEEEEDLGTTATNKNKKQKLEKKTQKKPENRAGLEDDFEPDTTAPAVAPYEEQKLYTDAEFQGDDRHSKILDFLGRAPTTELDISDDDLMDILHIFRDKWVAKDRTSIDLQEFSTIRYAAKKFNLEQQLFPENGGKPTIQTSDVEQAYKVELFRWVQLLYQFRSRNILDNSLQENSSGGAALQETSMANADLQNTFKKIVESMIAARWMLHSHVSVLKTLDPSIDSGAPGSLDPYQYMPFDPNAKFTPYQEFLQFVLQQLKMHGYKRFREGVWEPIYAEVRDAESFNVRRVQTHAWRICRTTPEIRSFVYSVVRKEDRLQQWKNMTSPGNLRNVVEYLEECNEAEFSELRPSRNLISFQNGILRLSDSKFLPFGHPEIQPDWVSCNYIDSEFDGERWGTCLQNFLDMFPLPTFSPDFHKQVNWEAYHMFFNDEEMGNLATPKLDMIFDCQLHPDQKRGYWASKDCARDFPDKKKMQNAYYHLLMWEYALLGRLMFPVGLKDNWQIIPYFKGMAASGKSTLLHLAAMFFSPKDVATVSNETRKGVGALQTVYDKYLWRVFEVKKDFQLSQAVFQSMVSGEVVLVDRLNKPSLDIVWDVPGILAGNDFFGWKDAAGSLSRRCVVTNFAWAVEKKDPQLLQHLKRELPKIIVKCLISYLYFTHIHEGYDAWAILPKYFEFTKKMLTSATDIFGQFLDREINNRLERGANFVIPLEKLMTIFRVWGEGEGIHKNQMQASKYDYEKLEAGLKVHKLEMVLVTSDNRQEMQKLLQQSMLNPNGRPPVIPEKDNEYRLVRGIRENKTYKPPSEDDDYGGAGGGDDADGVAYAPE